MKPERTKEEILEDAAEDYSDRFRPKDADQIYYAFIAGAKWQESQSSPVESKRIAELEKCLHGVLRLEGLIGYADLPLAAHLGEADAINRMFAYIKSVLEIEETKEK